VPRVSMKCSTGASTCHLSERVADDTAIRFAKQPVGESS
jgi:hypothetical protein